MILAALALTALALAATPASAATPQAAIATIYAPFNDTRMQVAPFDRPIFTPQLKALITKWLAVTPNDEVDDLSDFDWLCQCQDWDSPIFRARIVGNRRLGPGRRAVTVSLGSRHAPLRFVLQQAGGQWLIDDIFASGFRGGLRASLIRTTAADIALRKQR
jgi:hypothetical protein